MKNSKQKYRGHLLSIDLESWIFSRRIDKRQLSLKELKRLDNNYIPNVLNYLLKSLAKNNQKITFFIVGKLEDIYPGIIEKILEGGHEVGWHTHTHANILNKEILKRELESSARILKKYKIKGFQAPTITFIKEGYKILSDYGFEYSSSIYGNSNLIYKFGDMYEIPVTAVFKKYNPKKSEIIFPSNMTFSNIRKFGLPIGSAYFWSILGKRYYHGRLKKATQKNEIINMFIHDWQIIRPDSAEYHKDVGIMWNPLFYPYKKSIAGMFEHMLKNHTFRRFIDVIKDEKRKK